jgi:hypothetical protein
MEQQEESSLVSQLNYFEPVAGLFHFKMGILNLLFRGHRRQDDEVGSLHFCIEKMNRNVGMWNWKDRTIKDFRACSSFFTHLIDAHILAALAATSGVGHLRDLWRELGTKDWRKIIQRLHTNFGESLLVSDWRHGEDDSRDLVYENAVLLLQHGLVYQRFCKALITGDAGWVVHCLKVFTIWLQNGEKKTKFPKYRHEALHMMANFLHAWSPRYFENYQNQMCVNLSGKVRGFQPCDEVGELVIRWMKEHVRPSVNPKTNDFLRFKVARNVICFKLVSDHIEKSVGANKQ